MVRISIIKQEAAMCKFTARSSISRKRFGDIFFLSLSLALCISFCRLGNAFLYDIQAAPRIDAKLPSTVSGSSSGEGSTKSD
jgi:hypothetical protein